MIKNTSLRIIQSYFPYPFCFCSSFQLIHCCKLKFLVVRGRGGLIRSASIFQIHFHYFIQLVMRSKFIRHYSRYVNLTTYYLMPSFFTPLHEILVPLLSAHSITHLTVIVIQALTYFYPDLKTELWYLNYK